MKFSQSQGWFPSLLVFFYVFYITSSSIAWFTWRLLKTNIISGFQTTIIIQVNLVQKRVYLLLSDCFSTINFVDCGYCLCTNVYFG